MIRLLKNSNDYPKQRTYWGCTSNREWAMTQSLRQQQNPKPKRTRVIKPDLITPKNQVPLEVQFFTTIKGVTNCTLLPIHQIRQPTIEVTSESTMCHQAIHETSEHQVVVIHGRRRVHRREVSSIER